MKKLESLKDLKLGDKVAWRYSGSIDPILISEPQDSDDFFKWLCICQVSGFSKKTQYPSKYDQLNGRAYITYKLIHFDILSKVQNLDMRLIYPRLTNNWKNELIIDENKNQIKSTISYDTDFLDIWLLENEKEYLEIIKTLIVSNL